MKKLKKSLKNKKPVTIFIYGPMAVGKLTVAKILSKKLEYKMTHNHSLNDLVDELFIRGTYVRNAMVERLRYNLLENAVKAKINFVTTHCYAHNYISPTGLTDPKYVKTLEKKLTKLGAKFYPVHLKASSKELLRRVNMNSRKTFGKLIDKKIMHKFILNKDWQTSPKLKNNLVIDNTNLSPQKVSGLIIKHFKIKT
ncbi:AAA family ATPase [Candidatus Nomurabacteria bacterium]|nr:AAA family ATPase [Candidatus Nomurabacteria bacterium]